MDIGKAKHTALLSVKKTGKLLLNNFERFHKPVFKDNNDIVTKIDLAAERILVKDLRSAFPEATIITEEKGQIGPDESEYKWIIDPIDGTVNYFHSSAPFRVGVSLLKQDKPILSIIYNPLKNEMYVAEKGKRAKKNNKLIRVNNNRDLKQTVVMTHISAHIKARARTLSALGSIFRNILNIRVLGSGMAAATYIAEGRYDVFFNIDTHPWDILPCALLVKSAGGKVTDIEGREIDVESTSILATNGKVHNRMLKLLKNI